MTEPVRLAKRVAEMFHCSRREAELYIEGGCVRVDGKVVDVPQFRVGSQQIELLRDAKAEMPTAVTLLLHKAAGIDADALPATHLLTLEQHAANDNSGIAPHRRHFTRQKIVAALPAIASGLLILSQDWRIGEKLKRDHAHIEQEWLVEIDGPQRDDTLDLLRQPLRSDGELLPAVKVSWQSEKRLRFALKDYRPGQIEFLCADAGLAIVAMKRQRLGRLSLAGLKPGQWRYLGNNERI